MGPLPAFALKRKSCPSPHVERDAAHSQSAEPGEAARRAMLLPNLGRAHQISLNCSERL